VFNQFDIVAAQQAAQYLTGPYAGLRATDAASAAVPEPSAIGLAALSFGGLLPLVWRRWRQGRVRGNPQVFYDPYCNRHGDYGV
jgi:hypothetical protein